MGDHLRLVGAALEALDAATLVDLYIDGFVFEDVAAGATIGTRDEPADYFENLVSMPDARFSEVGFFQCEHRGASTWLSSGTNRDGVAFSVRGASALELADAGIQRGTIFYDPRPALG